MLQVFAVFIAGESVHLDTEGHSLLPAMLSRGELSTDAVDLNENRGVLDRVPEELNGVEVHGV